MCNGCRGAFGEALDMMHSERSLRSWCSMSTQDRSLTGGNRIFRRVLLIILILLGVLVAYLLFPDDLDIASDGTVWFTEASQRFNQHNWTLDFLETRPTGRLLSFDPKTGETKVRLDSLMFANGVTVGPDDTCVLVNETIRAHAFSALGKDNTSDDYTQSSSRALMQNRTDSDGLV